MTTSVTSIHFRQNSMAENLYSNEPNFTTKMKSPEKNEQSPLHNNSGGGGAVFPNGNHCDIEEPTFSKRRRRTNWVRVLVCCCVVLVCLLIMFVVLYTQEKDQRKDYEKKIEFSNASAATGSSMNSSEKKSVGGKCQTPECVIIASRKFIFIVSFYYAFI